MSEAVSPPAPQSNEFYSYLNGVANLESKIGATAVILTHPDNWFTGYELASAMNTAQGENPAWRMNSSVVGQYCSLSLEPVGAVLSTVKPNKRGGESLHYKAKEENIDFSLAMTGALIDWSLKHPDHSVRHLFGNTASRGAMRSPQVRYELLMELITGDKEVSVSDITRSFDDSKYSHQDSILRQIQLMRDRGILDLDSKFGFDPTIEIRSTEFNSKPYQFENTKKATQAVYKAMGIMGIKSVLLSDLIEEARSHYPELDMVKTRHAILSGSGHGPGFPGLYAAVENRSMSTVSLSPAFIGPVTKLMNSLEAVRSNPNATDYSQVVSATVNKHVDFRTLMAKAKAHSPLVGSNPKERPNEILKYLASHPQATVNDVMQGLPEGTAKIGLDRVRNLLNQLVENEVIEVVTHLKSESSRSKIKVYSLAPKKD